MGDQIGGLAFATSHTGSRMGTGIGGGLSESLTFCVFAAFPFFALWGLPEETARIFLNPVCGWDITAKEVGDISLRNFYFNRCISLREGYFPAKDDYLPVRAFDEPITDKYGTTWVWDRAKFEAEKKRHYVEVLKLSETGLPPRKGLERLGLDFVIPVLEPLKAVG
jgi:aldehyde:ferredoxin oxidoreductase